MVLFLPLVRFLLSDSVSLPLLVMCSLVLSRPITFSSLGRSRSLVPSTWSRFHWCSSPTLSPVCRGRWCGFGVGTRPRPQLWCCWCPLFGAPLWRLFHAAVWSFSISLSLAQFEAAPVCVPRPSGASIFGFVSKRDLCPRGVCCRCLLSLLHVVVVSGGHKCSRVGVEETDERVSGLQGICSSRCGWWSCVLRVECWLDCLGFCMCTPKEGIWHYKRLCTISTWNMIYIELNKDVT